MKDNIGLRKDSIPPEIVEYIENELKKNKDATQTGLIVEFMKLGYSEILKRQGERVDSFQEEKPEHKSRKEKEQDIWDSGSWIKEDKPDKQGYQWRYVGNYQCDSKRKGQAWCDRLHGFSEAYFFAKAKLDMDAKREKRKLEELAKKKEEKVIKGWAKQKTSVDIVNELGVCLNPFLVRSEQSLACALCRKKFPEKRQACDLICHELEMSPIARLNFEKALHEKEKDWWQGNPDDILIDESEEFLAIQKRYHEICVECEHLPDACSRYCKEFYVGMGKGES